jgi:hypothetical protein
MQTSTRGSGIILGLIFGRGTEYVMRNLPVLCCCLVLACGVAVAQGLSPKAGAVSAGLYTNLYFGMNYKLPEDWKVRFVGMEGGCERECVLLDAGAPEEKSRRAVTVTAELAAAAGSPERATLAGTALEGMGAKKVAPPKEILIAGRKGNRTDYSSKLVAGEVYYTIVVLPAKDYALVFSFSSESRKQLDIMVNELPKAINFVGQS